MGCRVRRRDRAHRHPCESEQPHRNRAQLRPCQPGVYRRCSAVRDDIRRAEGVGGLCPARQERTLMDTVRVLALDHYFDQDLLSLEAHPHLEVRRVRYQRMRRRALRIMGAAVGRGLDRYNDPPLAHAQARYAAWLAREVQRLYLEKPFDVIVLPSDTFFYVRTLPAAAHRLGLPVVVVQKETTIS